MNTPLLRRAALHALLLALLFCGLLCLSGCSASGDDQRQCASGADCPTGQVCTAGGSCAQATVRSCVLDEDCPTGQVCGTSLRCVASAPVAPTGDGGSAVDGDDMGAGGPADMPARPPEEDVGGRAGTPPEVVAVKPAHGSYQLPLNTSFTLRFSEQMRPLTVNTSVIYLQDILGQKVPATLDYAEASARATLTPDAPLEPGATYRLFVEPYARDVDDNLPLRTGTEYVFFTGGLTLPPAHEQLALQYAPALYQEVATADQERWRDDWPVALDFDGDLDAANNAASAASAGLAPQATVYYNVIETETHLFLQYLLYYPRRVLDGDPSQVAEHDFAALLLVIDRASGELLLAEGPQLNLTSEVFVRYRPAAVDLELRNRDNPLMVYDPASLPSPGGRYPMYVPAGQHESCNFAREGSTAPPLCLHEAATLRPGHTGALLTPSVTAPGATFPETMALPGGGLRRGSYRLVPFLQEIWPLRGAYGQGLLFDSASSYSPQGMRPGGEGSLFVPKNLRSEEAKSFGRMPFMWFNFVGHDNHGQWFLDPAYMVWAHWAVGDEMAFSRTYCYNPMLDIDRRGRPDAPQCPE